VTLVLPDPMGLVFHKPIMTLKQVASSSKVKPDSRKYEVEADHDDGLWNIVASQPYRGLKPRRTETITLPCMAP